MKKVIRILLVGIFALFTLLLTGSVRKSPNTQELALPSIILIEAADELPAEYRNDWKQISNRNPEAIFLAIAE